MKMDFSDALRFLKGGHRIRRANWNGKGMWLALWTSGTYDAEHPLFDHCRWAERLALSTRSKTQDVAPSILMRTADGLLVFGWLASQTDLLAEDWEWVVDDEAL